MKLMALRYDGTCSTCECELAAKSEAWWDSTVKQVTCLSCLPSDRNLEAALEPPTPFPPPPAIDHGVGGASATQEYERRHAKHERQIEAKWGTGRLGRFAKFMSDEPQSTTAWAKGAEGERKLARRLNDDLSDVAIVLHDRKVPNTRGNIDHLVVASNGVWIVDAKNYTGKVEQRDVGGFFSSKRQLFVGGRNQTKLIEGLGWQAEAVRAVLTPIGFGETPVHTALCFIEWKPGLITKPIRMDGALITWAGKLVEAIRVPGQFDAATIDMLARELSSKLPASS
ncbi:hypothetical protein BH10ACT2_BH10ACT2_24420 [soil metagenome]